MKRIVIPLLMLAVCVTVIAHPPTPPGKWKKVDGKYILNKAADSAGVEFGSDTLWISTQNLKIDTVSLNPDGGKAGGYIYSFEGGSATGASLIYDSVANDWTFSHLLEALGIRTGNGTTSAGFIDLAEDGDFGSNRIRLRAGVSLSDVTLVLPVDMGSAGEVLHSDGTDSTYWDADDGAGGGTVDSNFVRFSDSNSVGGANAETDQWLTPDDTLFQDTTDFLPLNGNAFRALRIAIVNALSITTAGWIHLDTGDGDVIEVSDGTLIFTYFPGRNVLADGTQPLTANWTTGDFDISGIEKLTADTGVFTQINISADEITDFAGPNLSVVAGVLTASGAGTADSMQVDTSGGGVYAKIYSTSGYAFTFREGNGIDFTADTDTTYVAVKLNSLDTAYFAHNIDWGDISTDIADGAIQLNQGVVTGLEIADQAIKGNDVDSTAEDFVFADAYRGTSAEAGSLLTTKGYVDGVVASDIIMDTIAAPTFSTVQELQNIFHSTGWTSGGAFTDTTDGAGDIDSLYIAAGTGLIRASDLATDTNVISFFDWGDTTIAIPADTTLFIGIKYNSGTPVVFDTTADKTLLDHQQNFELGTVTNEGGLLHLTFNPHVVGDHATTMIERTQGTMGIQRDNDLGGLILGETGTRNPTVTAGTLFSKLNQFTISAIDLSSSGSMDRYYQAAGSGFTKEAAVTQWNNTQWDDGDGGLATLANNKYAVQWFYIELDGALISMYGRAEHNSLSLAEGESPPATLPLRLTVNQAKLIGRILFQESAATASEIQTVFTTSFPATAAEDHGNLAGLSDDDHTQYLLRSQFPDSVVKIIEDSIATMSLDSAFVGVSPVKEAVFGATTAKPGYIMQEPDAHFGNAVEGGIEIGSAIIMQGTRDTTYNGGLLDLGGTVVVRQTAAPDGLIEFAWYENAGQLRFVIPKSGDSLGTLNPRSMFIAGPAVLNDSIVRFNYWGFSKITATTAATGADLGVQGSIEVLRRLFADTLDDISGGLIQILAGIDLNSNDIIGADSADIDKYTDGSIDLPDLAGNSVNSSKIVDQSIAGDDVDSTAENFVFSGAYHVTSAVADSEYVSKAYADAVGSSGTADSTAIDTSGSGNYAFTYSTVGAATTWREGTGIDLTADTDTGYIAVTADIANHTLDSGEVMALWRDTVATTKETILKVVSDSASLDTAVVANALTIPSAANPTTGADGRLAWDSDDEALEVNDGSNSMLIPARRKVEALIWFPDLVTDTVPIFYVDSILYPGGIEIIRAELQTSVDGAYSLIIPYYTAADPPVLSDYIDTLVVGAGDQRIASTTFENSTIAVGQFIYIITPATDIDWIRVSLNYYVKEFN